MIKSLWDLISRPLQSFGLQGQILLARGKQNLGKMHIPDGFLTAKVWIPAWLIAIGGLSLCLKRLALVLKDRIVPLMGVTSAFIFAAQLVNFPVLGGTSGHLLGGVLAAVLLGPWGGALVIAVVLTAQCLIFQDGGLSALGANILNMSFIATSGGYFVYWLFRRISKGNKGIMPAVACASWLSVVMSAIACAVELAISGTSPMEIVLPAMAGIHSIIGIGEAIITSLVISFILKVRPDLIYLNNHV